MLTHLHDLLPLLLETKIDHRLYIQSLKRIHSFLTSTNKYYYILYIGIDIDIVELTDPIRVFQGASGIRGQTDRQTQI